MEAILFGFFLGALAGAAAAVVVLRVLKNRRDAEFNKLVVELQDVLPDPMPEGFLSPPNLLSHNNLDWMKEGASK